jgi:alpha/beta superfamily hydrolase
MAVYTNIPGAEPGAPAFELEAVFEDGSGMGVVVAPPHPVYGGRLDHPVVVAVSDGLQKAGAAVLRFNFRGTGRSTGVVSDDASQADADYRAALAFLQARKSAPCVAAGYSFGAATALRVGANDAHVQQLLLIAPPLRMIDASLLRSYARPAIVLIGDDDEYSPLPDLQRALAGISNVQLHVIAGADHFFSEAGLPELTALSRDALR